MGSVKVTHHNGPHLNDQTLATRNCKSPDAGTFQEGTNQGIKATRPLEKVITDPALLGHDGPKNIPFALTHVSFLDANHIRLQGVQLRTQSPDVFFTLAIKGKKPQRSRTSPSLWSGVGLNALCSQITKPPINTAPIDKTRPWLRVNTFLGQIPFPSTEITFGRGRRCDDPWSGKALNQLRLSGLGSGASKAFSQKGPNLTNPRVERSEPTGKEHHRM